MPCCRAWTPCNEKKWAVGLFFPDSIHTPGMDTDTKTPPPDVRLSRKQLGDLFAVSNSTIKRRTEDGTLQPKMINSRVIEYTSADVDRLIQMGYRPDVQKAESYGLVGIAKPVLTTAVVPANVSANEETEAMVKLLILHMRSHPESVSYVAEQIGAVLWQHRTRPSAA